MSGKYPEKFSRISGKKTTDPAHEENSMLTFDVIVEDELDPAGDIGEHVGHEERHQQEGRTAAPRHHEA